MCRPCDGAALAVGALVQQAAQGRACATAAAAAAACWRECLKLWAAGRQNLAADDAPAAAAACLRLAAEAQSWQGVGVARGGHCHGHGNAGLGCGQWGCLV
eukprot:scaffold293372_cov17-Tisochrysis_lutea.AAC.2